VATAIGADAVFYQDLVDLVADINQCNPAIKNFDASCFDGKYITGGVTEEYLAGIEANRQDGETRGNRARDADNREAAEDAEDESNQLDLGFSTENN
jgi:amidophosphoribosyltransferase